MKIKKAIEILENYGVDLDNVTDEELFKIKTSYLDAKILCDINYKYMAKAMLKKTILVSALTIIPTSLLCFLGLVPHTVFYLTSGVVCGVGIGSQIFNYQDNKEYIEAKKELRKLNKAVETIGLEIEPEKEERMMYDWKAKKELHFSFDVVDENGKCIETKDFKIDGNLNVTDMNPFEEFSSIGEYKNFRVNIPKSNEKDK